MSTINLETIQGYVKSSFEFPIYFDDVWEALGYSTKGNAIRALQRQLVKDEDWISSAVELVFIRNDKNSYARPEGRSSYSSDSNKTLLIQNDKQKSNPSKDSRGGHNEVHYYLSKDGFKHFCLLARTKQGRECRQYFIQVEKRYRETLESAFNLEQAVTNKAIDFQTNVYQPWQLDNPEADQKFRELVGLPQITSENGGSVISENRLVSLVDNLSLAANRAGLAGNKATTEGKFLSEQLDRVRSEFKLIQEENDKLKAENNILKAENDRLSEAIKECKTAEEYTHDAFYYSLYRLFEDDVKNNTIPHIKKPRRK